MPLLALGFSLGVGTGLAGERRGQGRGLTWSHPLGGFGGLGVSFPFPIVSVYMPAPDLIWVFSLDPESR